ANGGMLFGRRAGPIFMRQAVPYYRVSAARQGRSGLRIEAQRSAVTRFAEAEGLTLLASGWSRQSAFSSGQRRLIWPEDSSLHTSLELANDGVSNAPTRLKEGSDERKTHCGQRWAGDTFPQTAD
ncbi:MAG: hypothetical protein M3453_14855, partial [Pseudomonadota bacterium]|nr:hypothetical protein [Pseudomonadota bacterium]